MARSLLGYAELMSGRLDGFQVQKPEDVQRLVFVCLGNICRSAFAEKYARTLGLPVASLGLSTTTGAPSPVEAVSAAHRRGIDLSGHRATNWNDFEIQPGDLFLTMEIRQAHEVRRRLGARGDVENALLGLWCTPMMPHLHDPFSLSDEYFDTCFRRVENAVDQLKKTVHLSSGVASTIS